jgi:signal transduction histidine kinase
MERREFIGAIVGSGTKAGIIFCLLALCACQVALAAEPKRVLMLHSFGRDFKPWKDYASTIRSELERQSPWPLDIQDQSLVSARSSNEDPEVPFIEYLRALYRKNPPDIIVGIGAPAAVFVQQHRQQIFPKAPMVFTAMEERRIDVAALTEYDSVVAMTHDFAAAIENILRVLPDTKNIMVVNGYSPNERFWLEEIRREVRPLESRVAFTWTSSHLSFEEILKLASELPPHSAIFWHTMYVDGAGVGHEGDSALKKLHAIANAPIFSLFDVFFGGETVGGPMHSMLEESQETAAVAIRILNGEAPGDIKVPPTRFATPKFDWREMQRWGISEKNLPPGSEILFREPTAWERYSWQIALIAAVILLQAGLISALLNAHRRRRLAEVQSRQRMAELAHVNRFSTAGELTASIAHEINQPLGSILTNAETADAILKSPAPDIAELKDIVTDILRDDLRASEVIRRMRSLLKKAPFELKSLDLNDVARETVEFISLLAVARKVELTSLITQNALSILGDRIQLQQVILNLVVNGIDAMKNTPAANRTISVRTSRVGKFAELSVSDRGSGIPEDKLKEIFEPFFSSKAEGMGMGLSIARTIVEAHGGQLLAENGTSGGATFRVRLPLASAAE